MTLIRLTFSSILRYITLTVLVANLSSCGSTSRYQQDKDTIPTRLPTTEELQDAIPRAEKQSRGGNKNYTVFGKNYTVLPSAENFKETGIASFYGEKFHGHLTSNGEIYNMYGMSAAHKNLPLPSYVKVRNLDNNRTVTVRVNDRGPFHPGRIIDLSYSAAYKLGISGIANVEIEAITDFSPETKSSPQLQVSQPSLPEKVSTITPTQSNKRPFIQIFTTRNPTLANSISTALSSLHQIPVLALEEKGLYRLTMGPFESTSERFLMLQNLKRSGYDNAFSKEMYQP